MDTALASIVNQLVDYFRARDANAGKPDREQTRREAAAALRAIEQLVVSLRAGNRFRRLPNLGIKAHKIQGVRVHGLPWARLDCFPIPGEDPELCEPDARAKVIWISGHLRWVTVTKDVDDTTAPATWRYRTTFEPVDDAEITIDDVYGYIRAVDYAYQCQDERDERDATERRFAIEITELCRRYASTLASDQRYHPFLPPPPEEGDGTL